MVNLTEDLKMARLARNKSRARSYSVGAVLTCKNGNKYVGCNIENQSLMSMCAERVAFASAIVQGEKEFSRIVIIGAPKDTDDFERCLPCGYCRQFMCEHVKDEDFKIYTAYGDKIEEYTLEELLPYPFKKE